MPAESVRSEWKSTVLKEIELFQCPPTSTFAVGARRMKDHHMITEKKCKDAKKAYPYTTRHPGNCLEVIQSKAFGKCNYTSSA